MPEEPTLAALHAHQLGYALPYDDQPCAYCDDERLWSTGFTITTHGGPVCHGCATTRLPAPFVDLAGALDDIDTALHEVGDPLRPVLLRLLRQAVGVLDDAHRARPPEAVRLVGCPRP